MLDELLAVVEGLDRDADITGLVLTGRGRLFSAGVDITTPFFMEDEEEESDYTGKRLLDPPAPDHPGHLRAAAPDGRRRQRRRDRRGRLPCAGALTRAGNSLDFISS